MPRFVFFPATESAAVPIATAKKTARKHGATVLRAIAGTMLIDVQEERLEQLVQALPGWRYSIERRDTRIPERRPLERIKAARKA